MPIMGAGTLKGEQVGNLLDDAEAAGIAPRVGAEGAQLGFANVAATRAAVQARSGHLERVEERRETFGALDKKVQRETFGGAMPEPGKLLEQLARVFKSGQHGSERGQGKTLGGGVHAAGVEGPRLASGLVERGQEGLLDKGPVLFEKPGVEAQGSDFVVPVDGDFDGTAAVRDFDRSLGETRLGVRDALLDALGLFEEFSDAGHNGSARCPCAPAFQAERLLMRSGLCLCLSFLSRCFEKYKRMHDEDSHFGRIAR